MSPEQLFSLASGLALLGWMYLLLFTYRSATARIVLGTAVTLLCILYASMIFGALKADDFSKFSTLEGVMSLSGSKEAALVGWIHYLAFDLVAGLFIANNASLHGISRWVILPCLLLTFMMGPVGLLLYLVIRWAYTKNYFAEAF
jgi:hypothetical protein